MSGELSGNTNFVFLKDLNSNTVVPRTNLAAVDLTTANGLAVAGNTIYAKVATADDIASGTTGSIVTPDGLYPFISQMQTTLTPGVGIDITSGTVSTADVPQSAITGLSTSLAAKQDNLTAGYRMAIVSGSTIDQQRYFPIETPSGSTVTLMAGHAYKIQATNSSKTLTAETIPANQFGLEGHAEIFLAGTGMIKTTSSVVLATALEPDSVNNCTVRFHDGMAIISVEDHLAGAIVTVNSGTVAGSLPYALHNLSSEYIAFDASTDGTPIDMANAVTYAGEKHIVGNGYTQTTLSGGVSCTSKTTFSNLGMNGVSILGGTMTLGDVFIDSGATVAVSGGGLAVEKVTGNGGVIDLGMTRATLANSAHIDSCKIQKCCFVFNSTGATFSDCEISGGSFSNYSCIFTSAATIQSAPITLTNVYIHGNTHYAPGGLTIIRFNNVTLNGSTVTGNVATNPAASGDIETFLSATLTCSDCVLGKVGVMDESTLVLAGSNTVEVVGKRSTNSGGSVTISSGAIIDLTGNTTPTPINPGGGVTFAPGGATVYPSAGQASAYTLGGMTVPQIGNTNVVDLGGTNITIPSGTTAFASGCFISGGSALQGGALNVAAATITLSSIIALGNTAQNGGGFLMANGGTVNIIDSLIESNYSTNSFGKDCFVNNNAILNISGSTVGSTTLSSNGVVNIGGTCKIATIAKRTDSSYGTITISSGATIDLTGNTNATPINPGGGITISSGGIGIIDSAGTTHEFQNLAITGATINNLGQILGATVSVPVSSTGVGPWNVSTTLGSSTVSATAEAQELVIDGGLVSIIEL